MSPANSRYFSGWSSVCTASRFSSGCAGMPFGSAHDAATPSCSRRRSQCRWLASCSWITNRPLPAALPRFAFGAPSSPEGSGVSSNLRLALYFARSRAMRAMLEGLDAGRALARVQSAQGAQEAPAGRPLGRRGEGVAKLVRVAAQGVELGTDGVAVADVDA